ncbi:MAG: N-formylglutamate amidohydrolase [Pseudomonadota bacterium]|nr:N-formylglutamate amidohydrolase [Pseudomonadota bacterium]
MTYSEVPLLSADDPAPVIVERPGAASAFFLSCDHAGKAIPQRLGDLGLSTADRERHIAWDIGALGVARELSTMLDATLVAQVYSRLVIDCNRPQRAVTLVPESSEATGIPGNRSLSDPERRRRKTEIYDPYHDAIRGLLDERARRAIDTIFIAIHSFTPVYLGVARPWSIGVLYGSDERLARPVLQGLCADASLCVGDNEPYRIDGKDHGIPEHALKRSLRHVLFELRQDLITQKARQRAWARRLADVLPPAVEKLSM